MPIRKSSKTHLIRKSINGKQQVNSLEMSPELGLKQAKVKVASYIDQAQIIQNICNPKLIKKS